MASQPSPKPMEQTSEDLLIAKKTVSAMIQSLKACALYPLTLETCQKAMSAAKQQLDDFLLRNDAFRIHIDQGAVFYGETPIYKEAPNHGVFAVPMSRDGLEWVEFQRGIQNRELNGFIGTLMRYRTLTPDTEGDIVTTLWEENYPHIKHEAKEAVWDAELAENVLEGLELQMTLPTQGKPVPGMEAPVEEEKAGEDGEADGNKEQAAGESAVAPPPAPNLADPSLDPSLWQLTEEEKEILREMVYEEENFDGTDSVLDVLMILLKQESQAEEDEKEDRTSEDIVAILSFLREEFQTTLDQGQIRLAFKLIKEIHDIRSSIVEFNPQAAALLDGFFAEISSPEVLSSLDPVWPRLEKIDPSRIKAFQEHLLLLHPTATLAFAPVLLAGPGPRVKQMLTELIATYAGTDPRPLETLLEKADEKLILKLIDLLSRLKGDRFQQMLLKLTEHPSESVRMKVLRTLLEKDPYMLWRLFHHIEDSSPTVSGIVHAYLGRSKDKMAESLMLDYLEEGQFKREDRDHIVACYKTLGRCGSDHSVGFLEDILLGNAYKDRFGGRLPVHKEGAADALAEMSTPAAYKTLKKAARSFSSKVRQIARKAMEDFK